MKIFNVRLGLATNSSSSHSLIFLDNPQKVFDDADDFEFGWNYFTAQKKETKLGYLAHILEISLNSLIPQEMSREVVRSWVGSDVYKGKDELEGMVDHQSVWSLPRTWDGRGIDKEFFTELKEFILNDRLTILGGNDNDDELHTFDDGSSFQLDLPRDNFRFNGVARKDPTGFWTIFNRDNGTKIRFSFDRSAEKPTKAYSPELVDLKITDYCNLKCEFCYQDSTSKGEHANFDTIRNIARMMRDAKVPEVALGGGATDLHPQFVEILEMFRKEHIVPNFTTKNLMWLRDREMFPRIIAACGAFAYSAGSAKEVDALNRLVIANGINPERVNIQYVMGISPSYDFDLLLDACAKANFRITLLGYKTVGRGSSFTPMDHKDWIQQIKKASKERWVKVCIDTALALEYEQELKDNQVPETMYHTKEGKFSLYIDAVTNKIGPSSYCNPLLMRGVDLKTMRGDQLVDMYRIF